MNIPGKHPCGPKSLVMFKRRWAVTRDTMVHTYRHTHLLFFVHVGYEVDGEVGDGRLESVAVVKTISLTGELTVKTITHQPDELRKSAGKEGGREGGGREREREREGEREREREREGGREYTKSCMYMYMHIIYGCVHAHGKCPIFLFNLSLANYKQTTSLSSLCNSNSAIKL